MKKFLLQLLAAAILHQTATAQTSLLSTTFQPTPEAFKFLLLSNDQISKNDTINEKIVDLVQPMLLDSVIERRKQHHKVFLVGWFIHAFGGYNWRAVSMKKEKLVGTAVRHSRSGDEEYTEYDINFDLNFHLRKYLNRAFDGYDLQKKYHKQDVRPSHHTDYKVSPFVRDTNVIDINNYRIHCELTPPRAFRPQLNYLFFPTLPGAGGLKEHKNFENDKPTLGFYGTYCLDCNHNCHTEIHPYEWMWWLKANDGDEGHDKIWHIGLFHEGSNRLKKWSVNPMTGSIKIPFAIDLSNFDYNEVYRIKVEHLVFNKFEAEEVKKVCVISSSYTFTEPRTFTVETFDTQELSIEVLFDNPIRSEGLRYWISDANLDKEGKVLTGFFNLATSVQDLYTARVSFGTWFYD